MTILIPALTLFVMIAALITVITADEGNVPYLPKLVWILLIVFLPLIGSIIWFVIWFANRSGNSAEPISFGDPRRHEAVRETAVAPLSPEDEDAAIEAEIRFHEKQAEIRRLEAEVERKRQGQG